MPQIDALDSGSSSQRDGLNHQAIEDYLKTIYMLAEKESPVTTSRLAVARDVKPASVTSMIKRLSKLKLVDYEKHYGVTLTESGERIALEVIRHHRLIELYLIEALGFSWDEVHEQADILEHVISEKLEERIAHALGNPTVGPHGNPIPQKDGTIVTVDAYPLITLNEGHKGEIIRIVSDDDGDLLRYLAKQNLVPGTKFEVIEIAPFEGPITVEVEGKHVIVGYRVAKAIQVTYE